METIASRVDAPDAADWVGIRRASEILGVHPSTLREWTRAGRLDAFVTPGWVPSLPGVGPPDVPRRHSLQRRSRIVGGPVAWLSASVRARRRLRDRRQRRTDGCDEIARCRSALARRLVAAPADYLLADDDADGERILTRAREDATEYGALTAQLGLRPSAAIDAFTRCRSPILRAAHQWADAHPTSGSVTGRALARVHRFLRSGAREHGRRPRAS